MSRGSVAQVVQLLPGSVSFGTMASRLAVSQAFRRQASAGAAAGSDHASPGRILFLEAWDV